MNLFKAMLNHIDAEASANRIFDQMGIEQELLHLKLRRWQQTLGHEIEQETTS